MECSNVAMCTHVISGIQSVSLKLENGFLFHTPVSVIFTRRRTFTFSLKFRVGIVDAKFHLPRRCVESERKNNSIKTLSRTVFVLT